MAKNNGSVKEARPLRRNAVDLDPIFDQLRTAVEALSKSPETEELQSQVCLLSRSAYTDFFSLSVLQGELDSWAVERLGKLLHDAIRHLQFGGKYRDSVSDRQDDFDAFCNDMANRNQWDTAVLVA